MTRPGYTSPLLRSLIDGWNRWWTLAAHTHTHKRSFPHLCSQPSCWRLVGSPALTRPPDQTRPSPHDAPPRANKKMHRYEGSQPEEAVAVAADGLHHTMPANRRYVGRYPSVFSVPDATS